MTILSIKNWSTFQHYKDRNPPWIKLKTDTFQNYEFSRLHDASKLLAICIWTLAARSKDGKVPDDLDFIKHQCSVKIPTKENLKELIDQGFIIMEQDASKMLASCKQSACSETETETETETENPPTPFFTKNEFDDFWSLVPNKVGKEESRKAFYRKRKEGVSFETLLNGVTQWQVWANREIGDYCPYSKLHPSTFLNKSRWADQPNQKENTNGTAKKSKPLDGYIAAFHALADEPRAKDYVENNEAIEPLLRSGD